MTITLSPETQKLLDEQMQSGHFASPDEVIRVALAALYVKTAVDYEDLDPEVRAAIDEGEAQYQRGEYRPWEEVRAELVARFIDKKK